MADTRSHRGAHPKDEKCFDVESLPALQAALDDLCWLLSRGYSSNASLKLVGDRYTLRDRQRKALQRCAASEEECALRRERRVEPGAMRGETLVIDGYNVLLTVEAALSGGVLLLGRDQTFRDMAAMSRHYRRVNETRPALELLAGFLDEVGCSEVRWYLDRPISNSGRLKGLIETVGSELSQTWDVELLANTDRAIIRSPHIVATADSAILDRCERWLNLARLVVERFVPGAWILDLGGSPRVT